MKNSTTKNNICCPKFDPAPWEEKIFQWKNKKFIKDNVLYACKFWEYNNENEQES